MSEAESTAALDESFDDLMVDFLDESGQLLTRLDENLMQLEEWVRDETDQDAKCDPELMNEMFRNAHSLKGLSGMLGLTEINELTHKVENVFDATRRDELKLTSEAVELLFRSLDCLNGLVQRIREPESDPGPCDAIVQGIHELLTGAGVAKEASKQEDAEGLFDQMTPTPESDSSDTEQVAKADEVESAEDLFAGVADEMGVSSKYLSIFIDETELALDQLSESMLAAESEQGADTSGKLLVLFHRIKGSAAAVGLNRPAKLAHLVEDLLQALHDDGAVPTPVLVDAMLGATDALRTYIDALKRGAPESGRFNEAGHALLAAYRPTTSKNSGKSSEVTSTEDSAPTTEVQPASSSSSNEKLWKEEASRIAAAAPADTIGFVGRVTFETDFPLLGLKARLVFEKLSRLGDVYFCHPLAADLEEMEEIAQLDFGLRTEASESQVRQQATLAGVQQLELQAIDTETVPDNPAAEAPAAGKPSSDKPAPTTDSTKASSPSTKPDSSAKPVTTSSGGGRSNAPAEGSGGRLAETLRVDIERLDQLMNLAGQLVISKARLSQIGDGLKNLALDKHVVDTLDNLSATLGRIPNSVGEVDSRNLTAEFDSIAAVVRRAQNELKTVHDAVRQSADAKGRLNEFFEAVHQLDRVTDGIQKSVMDTRMVPIGPLFSRFRRVVRDITRANNKQITLDIRGEKTELDKRMIDELGDPLIHMVRNSADHGVESPEDRIKAGKAESGTVTLDAFHRGNSIVIQVVDDGHGIDPQRIRNKAIQKGIIAAADAERLTDHQALQLIWEPGLSTAEKVTEISGRGMGMDIVRSKIEELNGAVELSSELGVGTTFTIKLPLTLAILPSLMAEIDGEVFALPVETVIEIVRVTGAELHTTHGMPTASVRGRVLSVVDLAEVFTWTRMGGGESKRKDDVTLVVVGYENKELALTVDRLLGEEDIVIKSLAENFQNVEGIAGASILGDGRVSLIVDIAALIEMSSRREIATSVN